MRFRRRGTTDEPGAVEAEAPARDEPPPPLETPPAPAQSAEQLDLTHAELERLIDAAGDVSPGRSADWRWYADYLRDRVDESGRIPVEYRLLLRIAYSDLPGMPELDPGQTATAESTAARSDAT